MLYYIIIKTIYTLLYIQPILVSPLSFQFLKLKRRNERRKKSHNYPTILNGSLHYITTIESVLLIFRPQSLQCKQPTPQCLTKLMRKKSFPLFLEWPQTQQRWLFPYLILKLSRCFLERHLFMLMKRHTIFHFTIICQQPRI